MSVKNQNGKVTVGDLPPLMAKLKAFTDKLDEEEIKSILKEVGADFSNEIDFESFLRVSLFLGSLRVFFFLSRK